MTDRISIIGWADITCTKYYIPAKLGSIFLLMLRLAVYYVQSMWELPHTLKLMLKYHVITTIGSKIYLLYMFKIYQAYAN